MIIDVHTHFFRPETDLTAKLLTDMKRCGVDTDAWSDLGEKHLQSVAVADVAIVFGLQAQATGWKIPNDAVWVHAARAQNHLIFFAAVDPTEDRALDELMRCHQDLRCKGLKLGPIYQNIHPNDPRCRVLYRYCQKHGLPVLFHVGTTFSSGTPLHFSRPAHIDQVAIDFPDLKIIMAHLGHPWEGETLAVIRRNANVYADISALHYRPWQFYNSMRLAVEYKTDGKLLLGSDFPFTTTAATLAGLRGINDVLASSGLPSISREVVEGIIHRDALSLLGLKDPRTNN